MSLSLQQLEGLKDSIDVLLEAVDSYYNSKVGAKKAKLLAPIISSLEKDATRIFKKQGRLYLAEMGKHKGLFPASEAAIPLDPLDDAWEWVAAQTSAEFVETLKRANAKALKAGGEAGMTTLNLGVSFEVSHPVAIEWLEEHAAKMVAEIDETTRSDIARIVNNGLKTGESYDKVARNIKNKFDDFAVRKPQLHIQSRAHLVAVTESANAYEEGTWQASKQLQAEGIPMEHAWHTVGDERVTDECLSNEADGWIDIDEEFSSSDLHPPRFPGCRCSSLSRVKEEK